MGIITMTCANCGGNIQLDNSKDFGYCMYCGAVVQLSKKVKVEHFGSISINGLATVENQIKKGFLNIGAGDAQNALVSFQEALAIEADNIYALTGMMCASKDEASLFYYKRVRQYSNVLCREERRFLNDDTCTAFVKAYVIAEDYSRLEEVLSLFPNLVQQVFECKTNNLQKAKLLVRFGVSPEDVFWHYGQTVSLEVLDFLFSSGMNVNATSPNYASPLALSLGIPDHVGSDRIHQGQELLDIAERLLRNGADPNVLVNVYMKYEEYEYKPDEWKKKSLSSLITSKGAKELLAKYGGKTGGCYVATAIYGSYDCPQVWTLRRYRDDTLARTWYGRAFIHTYYAISPTLVNWFGQTDWFRNLWKPKLDRMMESLRQEGVEDTPYQDKEW